MGRESWTRYEVGVICDRCRVAEAIPTHQFVKFTEKVRFLCAHCWEAFHLWFYRKEEPESGGDE